MYLLHPRQLNFELGLAAGTDDLKFLFEARETEARHAGSTRDICSVYGNMAYRFEGLCYYFSDANIQ